VHGAVARQQDECAVQEAFVPLIRRHVAHERIGVTRGSCKLRIEQQQLAPLARQPHEPAVSACRIEKRRSCELARREARHAIQLPERTQKVEA